MAVREQKTLSREDICAILKAASEAQVRVLKYGDLYLQFGRPPELEARASTPAPDPRTIYRRDGSPVVVTPKVDPLTVAIPATEIAEIQKHKAEQAREEEEILTREAQIEEALVEDPALFEYLLTSGELEQNGSAAIDNDD